MEVNKVTPVSGGVGIELKFNANDSKVFFPDLAILRGKKIKYIDVCDELAYTPSAHEQATTADMTNFSLTLVNSKMVQVYKQLPLSTFFTSVRKGNRMLINQVFDFSKSFLSLPAIAGYDFYIYIVVWFDEPTVRGTIKNETSQIDNFEVSLTRNRNYFGVNNTLEKKRFRSLLLSLPTKTVNGKTGIVKDQLYYSFLTLQKGNLQFIQQIPLYLFYQNQNAEILALENVGFEFTRSFIDIISDYQLPATGTVFFNCLIEQ